MLRARITIYLGCFEYGGDFGMEHMSAVTNAEECNRNQTHRKTIADESEKSMPFIYNNFVHITK